MQPWGREASRAPSEASGTESILPLHNMQSTSSKEGILRTIDVHVGSHGADSGLTINELGQQ